MGRHSKIAFLFVFVFSTPALIPGNWFQAAAGSAQVGKAPFRVVRSVCGAKGSHQGERFVMEDPRSVFYVPEDRSVIVYLELEGPVGTHRIEGFWKSPAGKVASLSEFTYTSQSKIFNLNLTLALLEAAATGRWGLDVHIDGEAVAQIDFQIVSSERSAGVVPPKAPLSPAEVY